jgi:hypothetical protein
VQQSALVHPEVEIDQRVIPAEVAQDLRQPGEREVIGAAACSDAATMLRAKPTMASPSAVSDTEWVSRSTRVRPTCFSRRRMCWLTVGCWRPSRAAARVKLPVCSTARKLARSCGS